MKETFKNFGPVYVINLKDRVERKEYIKSHFENYGITNYKFFEAYDGRPLDGQFKVSGANIGCTMSHLLAIKDWYKNSFENYLIICEDDISLDNSKYWNWTWQDIINNINFNFNFDIIHLSTCTFHIHIPEQLSVEKRNSDDTGLLTTCYVISRDGAKELLAKTIGIDGDKSLDFNDEKNIADHGVIFGNVNNYFIFPLFNQINIFDSDLAIDKSSHSRFQNMNSEHTSWLWKYNNRSIEQIINYSE